VAAGGAAIAGTWAGKRSRGTQLAPPVAQLGLVIDPEHLDFGEVWEDPGFGVRLPVRNVTSRAIRVERFETGCDCRPVEPNSLTIPPGETREVRLIPDRGKRSPALVGRPVQVETDIRAVVSGRSAGIAWRVRGTLRPPIATDLPAVLFGESNRAGHEPVARTLRVTLHTPGVLHAELVPPVAAVRVLPGATPTEWEVAVAPLTDRLPGPFKSTLTLTNRSPDGEPVASLALPVEGVLVEGDR
jgi:hypothetical protein